MRCVYCYNPHIVNGKGKISYDEIITFLQTRKGLLDAVVLSGGECTQHRGLPSFIQQIRDMGFKIKIDTNGSNSEMLSFLIEYKQVDYVALDFKALPEKYELLTQSSLFPKFEKTLEKLISSVVPFEVRTTLHSNLICKEDLQKMANWLVEKGYHGKYYLQNFVNDTPTLSNVGYSSSLQNKNIDFETSQLEIEIRN